MNPFHNSFSTYSGKVPVTDRVYSDHYKNRYNVIDNKIIEVRNVTVFRRAFADIGTHENQRLIPETLANWKSSEEGQWIIAKAVEPPEWHRYTEPVSYSENFAITARLTAQDYTFWQLKWGRIH